MTKSEITAAILVDGSYWSDGTTGEDRTHDIGIRAEFATQEDAVEFAALFPKYVGVKTTSGPLFSGGYYVAYVTAVFKTAKDNAKNETGERRIRAAAKVLAKLDRVQARPNAHWKSPLTDEQLNAFGFKL